MQGPLYKIVFRIIDTNVAIENDRRQMKDDRLSNFAVRNRANYHERNSQVGDHHVLQR